MSSILTSRLRGVRFLLTLQLIILHAACPQVFLVNTTRCVPERWAVVSWRLERFCQNLWQIDHRKWSKPDDHRHSGLKNLDPLTKLRVFTAPRQNMQNAIGIFPDRNPRKSLEIIGRGLDTQRRGIAHDSVLCFWIFWISDDFSVMGLTFQRRNLR